MDDAWTPDLRETRGSVSPSARLLMPDQWPFLTGARCTLRVLDEDDASGGGGAAKTFRLGPRIPPGLPQPDRDDYTSHVERTPPTILPHRP